MAELMRQQEKEQISSNYHEKLNKELISQVQELSTNNSKLDNEMHYLLDLI
jgi:hypothetical protein